MLKDWIKVLFLTGFLHSCCWDKIFYCHKNDTITSLNETVGDEEVTLDDNQENISQHLLSKDGKIPCFVFESQIKPQSLLEAATSIKSYLLLGSTNESITSLDDLSNDKYCVVPTKKNSCIIAVKRNNSIVIEKIVSLDPTSGECQLIRDPSLKSCAQNFAQEWLKSYKEFNPEGWLDLYEYMSSEELLDLGEKFQHITSQFQSLFDPNNPKAFTMRTEKFKDGDLVAALCVRYEKSIKFGDNTPGKILGICLFKFPDSPCEFNGNPVSSMAKSMRLFAKKYPEILEETIINYSDPLFTIQKYGVKDNNNQVVCCKIPTNLAQKSSIEQSLEKIKAYFANNAPQEGITNIDSAEDGDYCAILKLQTRYKYVIFRKTEICFIWMKKNPDYPKQDLKFISANSFNESVQPLAGFKK